jgi:hypothetical protein
MVAKQYEVTGEGLEWAQASLGHPVEEGKSYAFELDSQQETALVAAGWLIPKKGGK